MHTYIHFEFNIFLWYCILLSLAKKLSRKLESKINARAKCSCFETKHAVHYTMYKRPKKFLYVTVCIRD